jgi:hypothetical protein
VEDLDRCGLGSLLGLTGVGYPKRPTLFYGKECVPIVRDERFSQNSDLSFEASFGASPFVNSNTWHLFCNNFNLSFIRYCILICVVFVYSCFIENPPI